jgi:hypothetical protein
VAQRSRTLTTEDGFLSARRVARGEEMCFLRSPMIGRLGALVLLCAAMCGAGVAEVVTPDGTPPSRAQVLKLMSAMGVQQSVDASLRATQDKVKLAARASFEKKNPGADEATLKKLDEIVDGTPLFSFEDIAEAVIPVYQKNLSAGDVQAGIDFYSWEPGKRLLETAPVIIRGSNERGGPLVEQK